jgi:outer membrane protein assembly factor BamB
MARSAPRRHARPDRRHRRGRALGIISLALIATAVGALGSTLLVPSGTAPVTAAESAAPASAAAESPFTAAAPATAAPTTSGRPSVSTSLASSARGPFAHGLLIADRGNGRILAVDNAGRVFWRFPVKGSLPPGVAFAADDAFVAPDGKSIVANDETHQVIYRIDIRTRKIVWQYGRYGVPGGSGGFLHNPDDAYPLANGDIVVADIVNCRVIEIAPDRQVVRTLGQTGVCRDRAPISYGSPNGDTPLPDGGLLITEITGSRVVRLSPTGKVLFDIHVPVAYPSDAQLDSHGDVVLVDYSSPGAVVAVSPRGRLLWRYAPTSGSGRMDHPSLGTPLPNGDIVINDDARDRIIVLDPSTQRIVWQYGHTDRAGTSTGYLSDPDGHQPIPANAVF